jgi:NitT/TauT family transport system substrate-binding protein
MSPVHGHAFNSRLSSFRKRQSVLSAMILLGLDLIRPASCAQSLVDRGFTARYDYALQSVSELPYDKWREYNPEDTLRFYALRLHTDWRFFSELKRELKA